MVLWGHMVHTNTVLPYLRIDFHKNAYYGHTDLFSALNSQLSTLNSQSETSQNLSSRVSRCSVLDLFITTPDSSTCESHDEKCSGPPGKFTFSTPPFGTSAVKLVTLDRDRSLILHTSTLGFMAKLQEMAKPLRNGPTPHRMAQPLLRDSHPGNLLFRPPLLGLQP